jgi:hypothetical protein
MCIKLNCILIPQILKVETVYTSETLATQRFSTWFQYPAFVVSALTMNDCERLKSGVFFIHAATKDLSSLALLFVGP